MSIRMKKLIGTVVMIILVSLYAIFATAYASLYLANAGGWTHLAFFSLTGLLWVVPAMLLIRWMEGYKGKPRS
ncbi:hypothetical protein Sa4125_16310 [Aureimonas sp. SA4125]|uniref:DUF2842 domain-containing protein n=1 Tax=Aureimonas sp. SA4125 TaxID=2826993 RepID=UPI001CC68AAB|nr:DUF2842 domain-containing protein [Aureimonas sp. SA4125]BDA84089.1 hypothetical protein Sa4125_16310 [Aureimonas sp. SA4125]